MDATDPALCNEAEGATPRRTMNTEAFGKTLLELYRLSRLAPMQNFQRLALDAIRTRFDFDSAWWGMASLPPEGEIEIHASLPYHLPDFYPRLWEEIKAEDTIADAVMAQPDQCVNFGRKQLHASPGLASLMARFGITSCLCTVSLLPELKLMAFLSVYRVEGQSPFSEHERRTMQMLMPHLTASLASNWMLHLERVRASKASGRTTLGVVDKRGMLYVADQALSEALRLEWPQWTGPLLPEALVRHLHAGTSFNGRRLSVRLHPVGELWLLDLRPASTCQRMSPREAEIAHRFSSGASHKEIARDLGISPATARHHLREVYRKLQVNDKAALAHKLMDSDLGELDIKGLSMIEELPGAPMGFCEMPV
jgi:DNA-binding CsgD family transcriptional regulator